MFKCLAVCQPWATLLVHGFKCYETRSWATKHRGPVLIHASRRFDAAARNLATQQPFARCLKEAGYDTPSQLPLGAIIGIVHILDVTPCEALLDQINAQEQTASVSFTVVLGACVLIPNWFVGVS